MKVNKISLYQEGGALDKTSTSVPVKEFSVEIQQRIESGEPPEQVLISYLQQGVPESELSLAFESAGYDPSSFVELMQSATQMMQQMQQAEQGQIEQAQPQEVDPAMQEQLMSELAQATSEQPQMQYGGNTTARGPLESKSIPRPLYIPPVPGQGNIIGAAYMLSDAIGEFGSKKDKNKDGLRDGTFQDWSAKKARYKQKQLGNRTYDVNYGDNDPSNYVPTWEDLSKGKLRTKEEYQNDLFENSQLTFNPETNKYDANIAASQLDLNTYGVDQRIKNGLGLKDFVGNIKNLSQEERDMIKSGMSYEPGQMLGQNSSTDASLLSPSELKNAQETYKQIMLGQISSMGDTEINKVDEEPIIKQPSNTRSIMQIPNSKKPIGTNQPSYKEWFIQNSKNPSIQGLSEQALKDMYDNQQFQYGGDIPKAQFNIPDNLFGGLTQDQLQNLQGFTDMIMSGPGTPDYQTGVQMVKDSQLQNRQPGLGPTPFQQQTSNATATTSKLKDFTGSDAENSTAFDTQLSDPTVTRKRNLGNAFDQVETFIKDNPAMQAFGDVSQAAVMGANFANEMFKQKEFNDYRNKLRNTTVADNVYLATENPVNKRGTFDVNSGLAEPDNLVDYYAQAMYGKEIYQEGGEVEIDPEMLAELIAAGADIEIL